MIENMQNLSEYIGTVSITGNGQSNRFTALEPENPWTKYLPWIFYSLLHKRSTKDNLFAYLF